MDEEYCFRSQTADLPPGGILCLLTFLLCFVAVVSIIVAHDAIHARQAEELTRGRIVNRLSRMKWDTLTTDDLKVVADIAGKKERQ